MQQNTAEVYKAKCHACRTFQGTYTVEETIQ